jgi:hypothetical protein
VHIPSCYSRAAFFIILVMALLLVSACSTPQQPGPAPAPPTQSESPELPPEKLKTRAESIPADAVKITPETDLFPPILHSDEYEQPVPMCSAINTAGAEDSAFITPDGNTFYVFFTPDTRVPAEKQIIDGVTGIYVSQKRNGEWGDAERVWLQDKEKLSLDGCLFVQGDTMWFCTVRRGNIREVEMYTAQYVDGKWANWETAGIKLNIDYGVGELHITSDGKELYYHSDRPGSKGGYDIWVTRNVNGEWQTPENVAAVNTDVTEGWPFITEDKQEMWFTRWYQGSPGIFRSKWANGEWDEPELILSQFAGEPTLDEEGNIYFTHHFYEDAVMLEADIYVAYKK